RHADGPRAGSRQRSQAPGRRVWRSRVALDRGGARVVSSLAVSTRRGACGMNDAPRSLRVVIVDDEEPARMALRQDLSAEAGIEIIAECVNGFEAVKVVSELKPDLLFLDVQMPKLDGFDVLDLVGRDVPVVFVT